MEIVLMVGMLLAFVAGAGVAGAFRRTKQEKPAEPVQQERKPTPEEISIQNMFGYGVDGYVQKDINHDD